MTEINIKSIILFSRFKHSNQKRKSGEDYFSHIIDVVNIVEEILNSLPYEFNLAIENRNELIAAAYLHDTIEDTQTNFDDIESLANAKVAYWVGTLSEDNRLPRRQKHEEYWRTLKNASIEVKIVKLADIYSNLIGIRGSEDIDWIRYYIKKIQQTLSVLNQLSSIEHYQKCQKILNELSNRYLKS